MVYFVSDIHLGAGSISERKSVEQAFVSWLDSIRSTAEALYIAGDMFDFWFEYHHVVPKGFVRVLSRLASFVDSGVKVVFLTGNHDMWIWNYLQKECGIEQHTTPQILSIGGHKIYLAHGDNMNIGHAPMLRLMNGFFRSKIARFLFHWFVHPDLAIGFGTWWSGKSRKSHVIEGDSELHRRKCLRSLEEYAQQYASTHKDIDCFIFGHMHQFCDETLFGRRLLFLDSWHNAPNWIELDSNGNFELKRM
ncbi:MAG: UDP-2,3-diacylglucosamine diphosphatase [Alistipes sp.]|nr:UDP-2,3-diacylglucosamine diphosphatase [Candidatus Alistipes equi]